MRILFFLMTICFSSNLWAVNSYSPWSWTNKEIDTKNLSSYFWKAENNIELNKAHNPKNSGFDVYALGKKVNLSSQSIGQWKSLTDGRKIWMHRVESPTAAGFQFIFDQCNWPAHSKFYIYSKDRQYQYGPYNSSNLIDGVKLSTGLCIGKELILEANIPASKEEKAND